MLNKIVMCGRQVVVFNSYNKNLDLLDLHVLPQIGNPLHSLIYYNKRRMLSYERVEISKTVIFKRATMMKQ